MTATQIFISAGLAILILGIAIFDIYIINKKGKHESISAYIIRGSKKMPMLVFLFGLALGIPLGHIFWSMDTKDWMPADEFKVYCEENVE